MSTEDPYRMRKRSKPLENEKESSDVLGIDEALKDVLPATELSKIEARKRERKPIE